MELGWGSTTCADLLITPNRAMAWPKKSQPELNALAILTVGLSGCKFVCSSNWVSRCTRYRTKPDTQVHTHTHTHSVVYKGAQIDTGAPPPSPFSAWKKNPAANDGQHRMAFIIVTIVSKHRPFRLFAISLARGICSRSRDLCKHQWTSKGARCRL